MQRALKAIFNIVLASILNFCFFTIVHAADLTNFLRGAQEQPVSSQSFSFSGGAKDEAEYLSSLPLVKQSYNMVFGYSALGPRPSLVPWHFDMSLHACYTSCQTNSACHSFSYAKENRGCTLHPDTRYDRTLFRTKALFGNKRRIVEYFGKKDIEARIVEQAALEIQRRNQDSERSGLVFLAAIERMNQESVRDFSEAVYNNTFKGVAGVEPPDLFGSWTSNYGTINWREAIYGNNGDRLSLRAPKWSDSKQAFVMSGWWRGANEKIPGGEVSFVFDGKCSFTGSWNREHVNISSYSGRDGTIWTGHCNEFDSTAATRERQQQELMEAQELQRQQQAQEAARLQASNQQGNGSLNYDTRPGRPNLQGQWTSTYGDIHWEQNWYGERNNIIIMQEPYWDQNRGAWVAQGNYGKRNSSTQGNLEFVFSDACSFSGSWWPQGSNNRTPWTGNCAVNSNSQAVANSANTNVASNNLQPPNLSVLWSSTYGDINWGGGWYGEVNNFLSIGSPQWDPAFNGHVTEGYWGRRDGQQNVGGVRFVFNGPCSFIGSWWYHNTPEQKNQWTGNCK